MAVDQPAETGPTAAPTEDGPTEDGPAQDGPAEASTAVDGSMEALQRWRLGVLTITRHELIPGEHAPYFYRLYEQAFGPLRTRAAARHVLTGEEFATELTDGRLQKYVAWDADGRAIGLATITRELEAVPWISPEFYRARFPAHAARDALFYLGFVLARPEVNSGRIFHRLMQVMTEPVAAVGGVAAYDICAFNNQALHFADRIETTLGRFAEGRYSQLDEQQYYAVNFGSDD